MTSGSGRWTMLGAGLVRGCWPWLASLMLVLATALSLQALEPGQLFEDAACDSCHVAGSSVTADNASILHGSLEQLCQQCHGGAVEASHPSGLRPSMIVPEVFPLDWKGDLTCSSCHSIHGLEHGRLRVDVRGEAFCTQCHDISFFERMADGGGSLMISGHLDADTAPDSQLSDTYSIQCMSCHGDKAEATGGYVTIDPSSVARHGSGSINHPVGVDYAQASAYGGYHPVDQLAPEIVLPGGQVSCISCHESYSDQHGSVVLPQRGSSLCLQCHDL